MSKQFKNDFVFGNHSETTSKSIIDWYKGRSILITGASGFMGKVLIEKLLRACPGLNKIYLIIRPKRGMAPNTRINEIIKLPVFQVLKEKNPDVFKKLIAVEGDVTTNGLGITPEYKKLIENEVSVVFHNAATLKLEAELKESVNHNLHGTKNLFNFCKGIKKLEAILHLSTAFCHCDVPVLEEKIYPPTKSPQKVMELCDWMDEKSINLITPNLIAPHPNTYTFTKRLSETIAYEHGKNMPVVIIRPSIVLPTLMEPMPGWVDSLNGPVGVLIGAGKGVIRSMLVEAENHAQAIPVDIAINAMIASAWYRATNRFKDTPVYNLSQSDIHPMTWGEVLDKGRVLFQENPFDWPLWYPDGDIRTNRLVHNIIVFLFQVIPAYFMDVIFTIAMQKRFMVRIQKRIKLGMHLLQYFTLREWKFNTNELLIVENAIPEKEKDIFFMTNVDHDVEAYFKAIILGARLYCLKEKNSNIPFAKRYLKFLYILDRICKIAVICGLLWVILKISTMAQIFHENYVFVKNA